MLDKADRERVVDKDLENEAALESHQQAFSPLWAANNLRPTLFRISLPGA